VPDSSSKARASTSRTTGKTGKRSTHRRHVGSEARRRAGQRVRWRGGACSEWCLDDIGSPVVRRALREQWRGAETEWGGQEIGEREARMTAVELLRAELARAARDLGATDPIEATLDRPRDPSFGDWTTNLAMILARPLGRKPRDLAEALIARIDLQRAGVRVADVAGPGFINFRLETAAVAGRIADVLRAGTAYGTSDAGHGTAVVVEFVSANPTGPLHVGHGRQAALGDAVAALLACTGWAVSREFYYNDAGAQIHKLAVSVQARIVERAGGALVIPDGGYHGEYISELAERYVAAHAGDPEGRDTERVREFAVAALRAEQDQDLQAFGVRFDTYYLESSLYTDGRVDETVSALQQAAIPTSTKARSGSERRGSATTKTGSCARATAHLRTSSPISRTT